MARRAGREIKRTAAFWDTSALVPLCVRQSATARAISLYKALDVIVWWATPVEIASALSRLVRLSQISPSDSAKARRLSELLARSWSVIQPSEILRTQALQLVDRYGLRAADSLQLSAALEWCEGTPRGRTFLTADGRLRDAALLAGFDACAI
jgi:predicted nucleic acid-binding protein